MGCQHYLQLLLNLQFVYSCAAQSSNFLHDRAGSSLPLANHRISCSSRYMSKPRRMLIQMVLRASCLCVSLQV